jgi:hypothetical protein
MMHSIRWLGPLVLSAAGLVATNAAAQGAAGASAADAPVARDSAAAEEAAAAAARAAEDAKADDFDRTPKDCITLSNIKDTAIVDDSTILFYMRGSGKVTYRNSLPLTCPNLAHENRFSYKTTMNRLCHTDLITVLEQFGVGLRDGFTCRLGMFYPIPFEEAELLRKEHDKPNSTRSGMKTKAAEVPAKTTPPASSEAAPVSGQAPASEPPPPQGDSAPR